jgi:hypothetical protein
MGVTVSFLSADKQVQSQHFLAHLWFCDVWLSSGSGHQHRSIGSIAQIVGELCHVEALFKKKQASEQGLTGVGIRWRIALDGKRRLRPNQRSVGEYTADLTDTATVRSAQTLAQVSKKSGMSVVETGLRRIMTENFEDILSIWFASGMEDRWYAEDRDFDARIRDQFMTTYGAARDGRLNLWRENARSLLALIIVLDQFPRNMFRGDARAFATDHLALAQDRAGAGFG